MTRTKTETAAEEQDVVVVKKYANRRLYDTRTSRYITLDDLYHMVKDGIEFVVRDAKTDEDLTRSVLTQIIFEQEAKGYNMLPTNFLRQIIGFYDDKMQDFVPHYLEASMESFTQNQEQVQHYVKETMGSVFPFSQFEEIGKQTMELFQKTLSMFSPSAPGPGAAARVLVTLRI